MAPIKVVIIEDEPAAVDVIIELCQIAGNIQVEAIASNGIDALELLKNVRTDLVFLDIDIPMMNGMEVLQHLQEQTFEIIFTTGSEEHTFKAYKFEALDYLLKPIDPVEFQNALNKFRLKKELSGQNVTRTGTNS